MEDNKIPRLETIKRTAELFGVPVYFVRQKAASGEIVAVEAGRKVLINIDQFKAYLNTHRLTADDNKSASSGRTQPIGL